MLSSSVYLKRKHCSGDVLADKAEVRTNTKTELLKANLTAEITSTSYEIAKKITGRISVNNPDEFIQGFQYLAINTLRFEPEKRAQFLSFADNFNRKISSNTFQSWENQDLLGIFQSFYEALPHYEATADLSYMSEIALSSGNPKTFAEALSSHIFISSSDFFADLAVPVRGLVRMAMYNGESASAVLKELKLLTPILTEINQSSQVSNVNSVKNNLTNFFQGLVFNSWSVTNSMIVFNSCLNRAQDPARVLYLCALSATKGRELKKHSRFGAVNASTPAVLNFLSSNSVSSEELDFSIKFFHYFKKCPEEFNKTAGNLCNLIEKCRSSTYVEFSAIAARILKVLFQSEDPSELIDVLLHNAARSADNHYTRRQIEQTISSSDQQTLETNLATLRTTYSADLPNLNEVHGVQQTKLLIKQVGILNQAFNCFTLFRQVRHAIPLLESESTRNAGLSPSLLATFGYETAKNTKGIYCTPNQFPGEGLLLSGFSATRLFDMDSTNPNNPLHRYLEMPGWNGTSVNDFLDSEIITLKHALVISIPSEKSIRLAGQEVCAVFYPDYQGNYAASQCLIVAKSLINKRIAKAQYDILDSPEAVSDLVSVSENGFLPEDLAVESRRLNLPFFDIGEPTNIGGLSNSTGEFKRFDGNSKNLDAIFGLNDEDPWGNVKKMNLLNHPELFSTHSSLHENLMQIFTRFAGVYWVFENRYSAWKKGMTPVKPDHEDEWLTPLKVEHQNLRMLQAAYHCHLQHRLHPELATYAKLNFFRHAGLENGALDDFYLDIAEMKLYMADEIVQLPIPAQLSEEQDPEFIVNRYCFSDKATSCWNLNVSPHLSELMPVFSFS